MGELLAASDMLDRMDETEELFGMVVEGGAPVRGTSSDPFFAQSFVLRLGHAGVLLEWVAEANEVPSKVGEDLVRLI